MTRDEQIWNEACHRYADSKMRNAFVAAVKWAYYHPQMKPENKLQDFKKEVEKLHDNTDVEEYARQLAHLFLGNGLSLQTILLMAIDFGQQHPQWTPVEERLPEKENEFEDFSKLVVVTNGKDFWKGMYNYGGEDWRTFDLWLIDDATHWMEIVPPRNEE